MATVRKHRRHWCADFRDAHGFRRIEKPAGQFETATLERLAAQALLAKRVTEVSRNQYLPTTKRPTFSQVCTRFLESKTAIKPSTARGYAALLACYLDPWFGK